MSDAEFPVRSFQLRAEGYDRSEVDAYVDELRAEITELRRSVDAVADASARVDARLHDPEGAVTRTLAIAQETADRVLHDAQVEADRRRADAEESAAATMADADARAAKMLADIEVQTAEVRAQGIAAARAAIQVERDKAVAELGQIRRARDDLRGEAVELQSILERYARSATEASEVLRGAASGPLLTVDLPAFVSDEVSLAGVLTTEELGGDPDDDTAADADVDVAPDPIEAAQAPPPVEFDPEPVADSSSWLEDDAETPDDDAEEASVEAFGENDSAETTAASVIDDVVWGEDDDDLGWDDDTVIAAPAAAADISAVDDEWFEADDSELAEVISIDGDAYDDTIDVSALDDSGDAETGGSGAFLAEVRAAADDVTMPAEGEPADDSDRFLSELRGVTDAPDIEAAELDDAADRFFDVD